MSGRSVNIPSNILSNAIWLFLGSFVYSASQWAITVILAKFHTLEDLSNFSLALAVCSPIFLFFNMNIKFLIVVEEKIPNLVSLIYFRSALIFLACLISIIFYTFLTDTVLNIFLAFIVGYKCVESLTELLYALMQRNEKMLLIGKSQIVRGLIFISFLLVGAVLSIDIRYILICIVFTLVIALIKDMSVTFRLLNTNGEQVGYSLNSERLGALLHRLIPLGGIALIDSIIMQIPKYYLEYFGYNLEVGIFSSIILLIFIGGFVMSSVLNSILPKLSQSFLLKNKNKFKKLSFYAILLSILLSFVYFLVVYIAGEELLVILYNKSFNSYYNNYVLLAACSIFVYGGVALSFVLYAVQSSRIILYSNVFSVFLCIFLGYLWIPQNGMEGALYTFILSQIGRFIYLLAFSLKYITQ